MLVLHLLYDCRDAMGANTVNTAAEALKPMVEEITGGRVNLRILSNLADHRLARSTCIIPTSALAFDQFDGEVRARSHHRSVCLCRGRSLSRDDAQQRHHERRRCGGHRHRQRLARHRSGRACVCGAFGQVHLAVAVGNRCKAAISSGRWKCRWRWASWAARRRCIPRRELALKIMGIQSARELAEVIVSVGLAQNFAAIRALATEGIQRGHMSLHARQLAMAAGAEWRRDRANRRADGEREASAFGSRAGVGRRNQILSSQRHRLDAD